ncbi:hypothetical protein EMIHUDRAFT_458559 [Emiliania huxleyi CCMP1516]|uniref:MgtC/SapB/SrpB/YhiD N-terminal domain-containing protein n=2 Tax=Emiliania huxleyi TaxID=2903 RepID=A0A0D3JA47_EMIH1|nr:hypothetical protein EMIHUDRAFT_458559 [Emiliania huxleyi CCMP1516]EOD20382.1 hypothetical protein EMIHUDRAFT_458559 [Emiliania huxleyi CCMP1516]|eukprot:XP_005772811.1 hypothetical protein EMIHUDRAFT_458559 [Emiliania huxleyi CCMP1516]
MTATRPLTAALLALSLARPVSAHCVRLAPSPWSCVAERLPQPAAPRLRRSTAIAAALPDDPPAEPGGALGPSSGVPTDLAAPPDERLKLLERLIDERIRAIAATGDEDETPARQPGLRAVLLMLLLWSWPWALAALAGFLPLPAAVSRPQASAALALVSAQLETLRVVAARLLVATACGAMPRTHYRLHGGAGSALYTLASIFGIEGGDSVRAAAQICTGVGFIGAGVIAKGGGKSPVRGVTTACAVWVSAALGVVAASGMWLFALYSAGLSVTILRISRWYNRLLDEARWETGSASH